MPVRYYCRRDKRLLAVLLLGIATVAATAGVPEKNVAATEPGQYKFTTGALGWGGWLSLSHSGSWA